MRQVLLELLIAKDGAGEYAILLHSTCKGTGGMYEYVTVKDGIKTKREAVETMRGLRRATALDRASMVGVLERLEAAFTQL